MKANKIILIIGMFLILSGITNAYGSGIGNSTFLYYWTLDRTMNPTIGTATGQVGTGTLTYGYDLLNVSLSQKRLNGDYAINTSLKDSIVANAFGVCAYIKMNQYTAPADGFIFSKWDANSNSRSVALAVSSSGYPMFMTSDTGAKIAGNNVSWLTALDLNQPYFICGFYNSTTNILTINGTVKATLDRASSGVYWSQNSTWIIGSSQAGSAFSVPINASVDEVSIQNFTSDANLRDFILNGSLSKLSNDTFQGTRPYDFRITYYLCPNGSDANTGLDINNPIKTITKMNTLPLEAGDIVKRCGTGLWRLPDDAYPSPVSGITYTRYGSGDAPTDLGSWNMSYTGNWTALGGNVWESLKVFGTEIGNIIVNNNNSLIWHSACGALATQGDWCWNAAGSTIRVYSTANPATSYSYIEAAQGTDMWNFDGLTDFTIEYQRLKYGGRHGISTVNSADRFNISHNVVDTIGGVSRSTAGIGNCIEMGLTATNGVIYANNGTGGGCYDAGITPQMWTDGNIDTSANLTISYNIFPNSHYCYEYFVSRADGDISYNIINSHNTYVCGKGWSDYPVEQRNPVSNINGLLLSSLATNGYSINQTDNILFIENTGYSQSARALALCEVSASCVAASWYQNNNLYLNNSHLSFLIDQRANQYRTLAAYKSGVAAGNESNGVQLNNTKLFGSNTYNPLLGSLACSMGSTGSYVGALPCAAGLYPGFNLANVGNKSVSNDTITLNWTIPSDPDYNRTDVYRGGVKIGNTSISGGEYGDAGLAASTTYTYILRPFDDFGNYGDNSTITITTYPNNASSAPMLLGTNFTAQNSEIWINLTFLQKPFFFSFNITINNSNPIVTDFQTTAPNYACNGIFSNCVLANDGDYSTFARLTGCVADHLYKNFTNYANYTGKSLHTASLAAIRTGSLQTSCINSSGMVEQIGYFDADTPGYLGYQYNYTIPASCRQGSTINLDYLATNHFCGGFLDLYETNLFSRGEYYAKFDLNTYMNLTNETNSSILYNLTAYGNAMTNENATLVFGALNYNQFVINYSWALAYNKTINVSVLDIRDNSSLNPLCSLNGAAVHPASEFMYYNSSLTNLLNCSLIGYGDASTTLTPMNDSITLYMGGFGLNITLKNEQTDNAIIGKEMFVYIVQGSYAANYTTTNGSMSLNYLAMPPGEFEIRYGGQDYATRSYFVTLTQETNLELYDVMLNESSLIVFNVIDERGYPVNDGLLKIQRYFIGSGAYKLVAMEKIDGVGNAGVYLVPDTVPYIVTVEKDDRVVFMSLPNKIFLTSVQIHAILLDNPLESFYKLNDGLTTSLTFNNQTKVLSYFWNDASGIVREACVEVLYRGNTGTGTLGSTCASSSTGTLFLSLDGLLLNNTEYTAQGTVKTTTTYSDKVTNILTLYSPGGIYEALGKPGLFWAYLLILTMFFIGLMFDFAVAVIYTSVSLLIVNFMGIGYFPQALIVGISLIGLLISMVSKRT